MARDLTWRTAVYTALIYGTVALAFTAWGTFLGPPAAETGGTRPTGTIPGHLAELAVLGLLLGLACMVIYGRKGLPLIFLMPTLTILLDVDHLPAYLGLAEPIRPAHSLLFIIVAFAVTAITIKALDIELVVLSAFMAHMAVDTGLFPPFSPISCWYTQLGPYRAPFAAGAVLCAVVAGVALRRQGGVGGKGGLVGSA